MRRIINEGNIILEFAKSEYDALLVPMGINNSFYSGFRHTVSINFKEVVEEDGKTGYGDRRKFGTIKVVKTLYGDIVLCYFVENKSKLGEEFINYDYLNECLEKVGKLYKDKKLISPVLGALPSDGNGNKEKIIGIIDEKLSKSETFLYSNCEDNLRLFYFRNTAELRKRLKDKEISPQEYIKERSRIDWESKNGILSEMPKDYVHIPRSKK